MEIKTALSLLATAIAIVSYVPYIRDMRLGKTKPHAFSWLIWSILAYIAGIAQLTNGGGVGSMVALVTATICLWIAVVAYEDGSVAITKSDWASLISAIAAIPVWLITKQPLLSVIIISVIDVVGFWPTFRKSFNAPHQETLSTHYLSTIKHVITIAAQQRYSLVTVLYPASLGATTALFVAMLLFRRPRVSISERIIR